MTFFVQLSLLYHFFLCGRVGTCFVCICVQNDVQEEEDTGEENESDAHVKEVLQEKARSMMNKHTSTKKSMRKSSGELAISSCSGVIPFGLLKASIVVVYAPRVHSTCSLAMG